MPAPSRPETAAPLPRPRPAKTFAGSDSSRSWLSFHLERITLYDIHHEPRKMVPMRSQIVRYLRNCRLIETLHAPPQGKRHHLLRQVAGEQVRLRSEERRV